MPGSQGRTLAFLFADIEGSTARWESQRKAMAVALAHCRLGNSWPLNGPPPRMLHSRGRYHRGQEEHRA